MTAHQSFYLLIMVIAISSASVLLESEAESLFREYWEVAMEDDPELATSFGDHRYNDKLTSYSLSYYEGRKTRLTAFLERANELLTRAVPGTLAQTNLEAFVIDLNYKLDRLIAKSYLFPVSYLEGPPITLVMLLDYVPMENDVDFWNLIARYKAFPEQVEEVIELLNEGIRTNMVLHERSLKKYEQMVAQFKAPAEESMFYEPFAKVSNFVSSEKIESYQQQASLAINNFLNPALQRLSDFIHDEYRKHLRNDIAVSSLPNGEEYYRKELNFYLTAEVTPQEIHSMGVQEVEFISKEMQKVIDSLGLSLSRQQFNNRLRANESFFFGSGEEALNAYKDLVQNEIQPELPNFFKTIPVAQLLIKRVPDNMAGGPVAYYLPASPDGSTKGTFFIDTTNLKNLPKYEMVTNTLHEAIPGHHLQMSYTNEQQGVPMFRKRVQYPTNTAFLEGWALYCEYLGIEMGMYKNLFTLYGHLSQEMFRACRLVTDTGIHALGWSRERAVEYMVENSASPRGNVENEIDRYITWPGQACSYKYGEIKIKQLRKKAEATLENQFDLKDFHDTILQSFGSMAFVEKQVNRYIARQLE